MNIAGAGKSLPGIPTTDDRLQQLKAFDESKAGVNDLVDSGITRVPQNFIRPLEELAAGDRISGEPALTQFRIPVIDLKDLAGDRAREICRSQGCGGDGGVFPGGESWMAVELLEEMLGAAREFHELALEVKGEYYTREKMKKVKYVSNFDLYQSKYANWRDTLFCVMGPEPLQPQQLPPICRVTVIDVSS